MSRRRVAPDRQPAPAAGGVEPALGRHAVRVLEDPDLVEVALVRVRDPVRDGPSLAAEDELVERTAAAARAVERVHQRVPAEPWSARTWSRRKRSSANGAISSGGRPVAISSAIPSPPAGIALKPHVPQPVVTRKPSTRGRAHDRAVVDGDVAQPGPRPQDPHVTQERQQQRDLVGVAAQGIEGRLARVRRLRVELGADEHLAALGLRHVAHELRAGHDRSEALRVVVRDERVERMGPDRQPDAGHAPRAAVTRPPTADRTTPAAIGPAGGLDADDALAVDAGARHRRVLEDVDAALRRAGRVRPGHPIVAGRRARDVMRGAEDRVAAAAGQVDLRDERLDLRRA